jgi:outer membrane protein, heavy metal efflux system
MRSLSIAVAGLLLSAAVSAQDAALPARLSLDEALRLAEARNPQLAGLQYAVAASLAGQDAAARRPNPVLNITSEGFPFSEPDRPPFLDDQELTVSLQQDLELGGRRRLRTQAAQLGVDASRETLRDAQRRLRFQVSRAYMQAVLASANEEAARASLEEIDQVLAVNRTRYEQGELSGVELRRLQVERFRFADDALAAELAVRNARGALLALLNVGPLDQAFALADGLALPAAGLPEPAAAFPSAVAEALTARPDLAAARRERERAEADLGLQRALQKPPVSIEGGLKRDFGTNGLLLSLTMPLQFFNRNQAGVALAEAEGRMAAARVAEAETAVSLDVQEALNGLDVSRRRVGYIEGEYLESARAARDIVLASYRAGAATLTDYLDAERALRAALGTLNRARFDYRVSVFQYEAALGGSGRPQ